MCRRKTWCALNVSPFVVLCAVRDQTMLVIKVHTTPQKLPQHDQIYSILIFSPMWIINNNVLQCTVKRRTLWCGTSVVVCTFLCVIVYHIKIFPYSFYFNICSEYSMFASYLCYLLQSLQNDIKWHNKNCFKSVREMVPPHSFSALYSSVLNFSEVLEFWFKVPGNAFESAFMRFLLFIILYNILW